MDNLGGGGGSGLDTREESRSAVRMELQQLPVSMAQSKDREAGQASLCAESSSKVPFDHLPNRATSKHMEARDYSHQLSIDLSYKQL